MLLTIDDIKEIFTRLIDGNISREEADRWAYERIQASDSDSLEFDPVSDKLFLWSAVMYLFGVDMMISPGEYMHSLEDIKETFEERWNR